MISRQHWKSYYQDNLILKVITKNGLLFTQRKRLPVHSSEHLRTIQRAYRDGGISMAVKIIRETRNLSLKDAFATFNVLRGSGFKWTHL